MYTIHCILYCIIYNPNFQSIIDNFQSIIIKNIIFYIYKKKDNNKY